MKTAPRVALIRGINVGGKNKLAMTTLAECFTSLGCEQVKTYIQSGNVLFLSSHGDVELAEAATAAIRKSSGLDVGIVVRSLSHIEKAVADNPFDSADTAQLYIGFLAGTPAAARIADIDPERFAPDTLKVVKDHVYALYANGAGRSKLTLDYIEKKLGTRGTFRNWRTTHTLIEKLRSYLEG